MDAIFMSSSSEKSFSPYKQFKNMPKRNGGANFVSKPRENLAPATNNIIHGGGGLLFAPPPPPPSLSFSYPRSVSLPNSLFYQTHGQLQQPPLLPLPVIRNGPLHSSIPSRTRSLSSSPPNRKNNKTRDQSRTPKRSKSKQIMTVKVEEDKPKKPTEAVKTQAISKSFAMAPSTNPTGPDLNVLPKVIASSYLKPGIGMKDLETFSGSVFTISPPPSSLPLPKFSLRPKLSCNAEAAGVDSGATDDLRRLLRLR